MANEHGKRCSAWLTVTSKPPRDVAAHPLGWPLFKQKPKTKKAEVNTRRRGQQERGPLCTVSGNVNWSGCREKQREVSLKNQK